VTELPGWVPEGVDVTVPNAGQDAGDRLLAGIGTRLAAGAAFVAHLADERFALVVPDTAGPDDLVKVAEQANRALARSMDLAGYLPALTATAGLAEGTVAGTSADGWLRAAAVALDWAIGDGTGYALFQPGRTADDLRRHRLSAAMPAAASALLRT
jgi:GGDEF domain-containing protein